LYAVGPASDSTTAPAVVVAPTCHPRRPWPPVGPTARRAGRAHRTFRRVGLRAPRAGIWRAVEPPRTRPGRHLVDRRRWHRGEQWLREQLRVVHCRDDCALSRARSRRWRTDLREHGHRRVGHVLPGCLPLGHRASVSVIDDGHRGFGGRPCRKRRRNRSSFERPPHRTWSGTGAVENEIRSPTVDGPFHYNCVEGHAIRHCDDEGLHLSKPECAI
jgi:hypothetical protein